MQNVMKLNLTDLVPQEAPFSLSSRPGKTFKLCAYTLRVQAWAEKRYDKEQLQAAIMGNDITAYTDLVYYMLVEKKEFPDQDNFLDAVTTFADRQAVTQALLTSIGLSQPILKKLAEQVEGDEAGNAESPSQKTGASITTESPSNTATA